MKSQYIYQHPPAPFTDKKKPKDPKPNLPIDQYTDIFVVVALLVGLITVYRKRT